MLFVTKMTTISTILACLLSFSNIVFATLNARPQISASLLKRSESAVRVTLPFTKTEEGLKIWGVYMGFFGLVWFGLVWFGLVWFGLVWSDLFVWMNKLCADCYHLGTTERYSICTSLGAHAQYYFSLLCLSAYCVRKLTGLWLF